MFHMMRELSKIFIVAVFACVWNVYNAQNVIGESFNPANDLSAWQQHQRNPRVASANYKLSCERPNIYICEEPTGAIPVEAGKVCNFRNVWYHEQVFKWVAGRGCLLYTPDFLYINGSNSINLNSGCVYRGLFAPCLEIVKSDGTCGCYPFDPSFVEVTRTVRNSLVPTAQSRWESCYNTATMCCNNLMDGDNNDENECSPTFDGWTCWQPQRNGSVATSVCSEFAYSNTGPSCYHYSTKQCYSNATWELQTDYSTCSISPRLVFRYHFHIAMLAVSTIACLPAICIFLFYKRMRVTRVALHRNLLIAIILRNILVMISRNELYIDELTNANDTKMSIHGVACRILAVAERTAGNAVFVCMLIEGIYLHRLIVSVFKPKLNIKWLYGIGAAVAIVPVVVWSVIMAYYDDHSCWAVYTTPHIQWVLDAPRLLILGINTILFIDVLRVLLTKIRNSENANQLSTSKATLFLMPLFGIQFIFTAIRPNTNNCGWEQSYYLIAYVIEGLQGFIVAVLYCYANKEVRSLIKATYKRTEGAFTSRVKNSNNPRSSANPNTDRRLTYSTNLQSHNDDKNHYSTITPRLHVAEIISIQTSERLAEILDPTYETIDYGVINEAYDKDRNIDDYYGFTKASSVSIGYPDWIQSAPNSIYNNSVNENEETVNANENNNSITMNDNEYIDDRMLDEIMQCIDITKDVQLNPDLLSPNRPSDDKIEFLDN